MLTKNDLKAIENLLESKLEEKLENKLDSKFDEKLKPIYKKLNRIDKKIDKTIFAFDRMNHDVVKNVRDIQSHLKLPVMDFA